MTGGCRFAAGPSPREDGWIQIPTAIGRTLWRRLLVSDQIATSTEPIRCDLINDRSIRTVRRAIYPCNRNQRDA